MNAKQLEQHLVNVTRAAAFFGTSIEDWAKVKEHHTWDHAGRGQFHKKWMKKHHYSYSHFFAMDNVVHGEIEDAR